MFPNHRLFWIGPLINVFLLMKGDVYPVEPFDDFAVNQVLDPHWGVLNDEDVRYLFATDDSFTFCFICFLQCSTHT